jgi:sulfoxide reductase heme-binding subunit YedZ
MVKRRASKVLVFALGLAPLVVLLWRAYQDRLTANPIEYITHYTGDWTLRFIIFTLSITPLRKVLGQPGLIRYRRMIGLFAFFYACLHFLTYLVIDKFFDWKEILTDIGKRTYITVGFTGFVMLTALAVTSTAGWIRRLGGKRWQLLHRLIYLAVVAGVVHYYWSVKSDVRQPVFYGVLAALLLAYRWKIGTFARPRLSTPVVSRAPETVPR